MQMLFFLSKIYLKYIYFMLNILQIHLHIYVHNISTLQLHCWCTKFIYFYKFSIFMHSSYPEIVQRGPTKDILHILKDIVELL